MNKQRCPLPSGMVFAPKPRWPPSGILSDDHLIIIWLKDDLIMIPMWSNDDLIMIKWWSTGCFSKDCPQHWQLPWEDEQPKHNCCWHSRLQGAPLFLMFLSEFLCCQMFSLFVYVFYMLIGTGPTGHRICGGTYECSWRRGLKAKQSKCYFTHIHIASDD